MSVSCLTRSSASRLDTTGRSTVTNNALICELLLTRRINSSVFCRSLLMYNWKKKGWVLGAAARISSKGKDALVDICNGQLDHARPSKDTLTI